MKPYLLILVFAVLPWCSHAVGQEPPRSDYGFEEELNEPTPKSSGPVREWLSDSGLILNFDATYVFQGVATGGYNGPYFSKFSNESHAGNTWNGDLRGEIDTEKAGWWAGGTFRTRLQSHVGRSITQRAGSIAAVNNEALFPNVVDKFDLFAFAVTEMAYEHQITETISIYGGLLNTSQGDENVIAGSAQSHSHFLNFALLYSGVEDATTGNTALGSGISWTPNENVTGSFSVYGAQETAGENPFLTWHGTTLSTEWTIKHKLGDRTGAQTFGYLYGIDVLATDIAKDPRLVLISIILGLTIPPNPTDTWAFYYNAHQFIQGDETGGWGVFVRYGLSDGNPNFIKQNAALGLGGVGLFPSRERDRWGCGVFLMDSSNAALLKGLHITDEVGGEAYYAIVVSDSFVMTLDAQMIDSGLPRADSTCVLGLRGNYSF